MDKPLHKIYLALLYRYGRLLPYTLVNIFHSTLQLAGVYNSTGTVMQGSIGWVMGGSLNLIHTYSSKYIIAQASPSLLKPITSYASINALRHSSIQTLAKHYCIHWRNGPEFRSIRGRCAKSIFSRVDAAWYVTESAWP